MEGMSWWKTKKKCIFIMYTLPEERVSCKKKENTYVNWHIRRREATRDA